MTERMTKLMAQAALHLPAVPDPIRLDHAARLLGGDDPKARGRWLHALRVAAERGDLVAATVTPEPREVLVTHRVPEHWRRYLGRTTYQQKEPRQPPPYSVVALAELRRFLERHGEQIEQIAPWLLEVPAAPAPTPPADLAAQGGRAKADKEWGAQKAYAVKRFWELLTEHPDWRWHEFEDKIVGELVLWRPVVKVPEDHKVIRGWIKADAKARNLSIPAGVSRRGQ